MNNIDSQHSVLGLLVDLTAIASWAIWYFSDNAGSSPLFMVVLVLSSIIFGWRLLLRWVETL